MIPAGVRGSRAKWWSPASTALSLRVIRMTRSPPLADEQFDWIGDGGYPLSTPTTHS